MGGGETAEVRGFEPLHTSNLGPGWRDREHVLLSMDHSGSEQESGAEMLCVDREDGELTQSDFFLGAEPCARH